MEKTKSLYCTTLSLSQPSVRPSYKPIDMQISSSLCCEATTNSGAEHVPLLQSKQSKTQLQCILYKTCTAEQQTCKKEEYFRNILKSNRNKCYWQTVVKKSKSSRVSLTLQFLYRLTVYFEKVTSSCNELCSSPQKPTYVVGLMRCDETV